MPNYSRMLIKNLKLMLHLGWPQKERKQKQAVFVDIHLKFKTPPNACSTDELHDTICYHSLCDLIRHACRDKTFRLIEHATATIYQLLKNTLKNKVSITVTLTKQPKALKGIQTTFSLGDEDKL